MRKFKSINNLTTFKLNCHNNDNSKKTEIFCNSGRSAQQLDLLAVLSEFKEAINNIVIVQINKMSGTVQSTAIVPAVCSSTSPSVQETRNSREVDNTQGDESYAKIMRLQHGNI